MQKMWAIAAITLVGFMMIISSIPQDAFAGKETVKLSLNIVDNIGKVKNALCNAISFNPSDFDIDNSGNSGKVSFTFEFGAENVDVTCQRDDGTGAVGPLINFVLDGKNTRLTYEF